MPLWSTGFIFTKFGLPYAEPMSFLSVRFALVVPLMIGVALAMRAAWPSRADAGHSMVVGILLHGALSRRRLYGDGGRGCRWASPR